MLVHRVDRAAGSTCGQASRSDAATDARADGTITFRCEFNQCPSQAHAPAPWLPSVSRSNPDAAVTSCHYVRQGRHPPCGAVVAIASDCELDDTIVDGSQGIASAAVLG
jgi:hypothetical protein